MKGHSGTHTEGCIEEQHDHIVTSWGLRSHVVTHVEEKTPDSKLKVGHLIRFERIRMAAKSEGVLGFDITQMPLYAWYRSMSTMVGAGLLRMF